jgi:ribonuclease J
MMSEVDGAGCLNGARPSGPCGPVLRTACQKRLLGFFERHGIPLVTHHASGHAYLADLKRLATAIAPGRLVPIHSFAPDRFGEFFDNVEVRRDGDWWTCSGLR